MASKINAQRFNLMKKRLNKSDVDEEKDGEKKMMMMMMMIDDDDDDKVGQLMMTATTTIMEPDCACVTVSDLFVCED